jgi:hypothetical protein
MEITPQVQGRPIAEIRRLVAEDTARFETLAATWNDLTVSQQIELVKTAQAMEERNE